MTDKQAVPLLTKARQRHGMKWTREYRIWENMKARCTNPRNKSYRIYGGRGIAVCERWASDFSAFYADMGPCPDGHSIDRINGNKGYEPGNCRWADRYTQNANTSRNIMVNGQSLMAYCRDNNLQYATILNRLAAGWDLQSALSKTTYQRLSDAGPRRDGVDFSVKLTREKAAQIRERGANGVARRAIASEFRVSLQTVHHVLCGRTWKVQP